MQITLLTDGSSRVRELTRLLDESGIGYETQENKTRHDLPILIIDNKELNYTKALRWIRKKVREYGETLQY